MAFSRYPEAFSLSSSSGQADCALLAAPAAAFQELTVKRSRPNLPMPAHHRAATAVVPPAAGEGVEFVKPQYFLIALIFVEAGSRRISHPFASRSLARSSSTGSVGS